MRSKIIKSFQKIRLHVVMFKITGLKICLLSNNCIVWMGWGDHIKSFSSPFQRLLNYCRKFEDVKFNSFWKYDIVKSVHLLGDNRYHWAIAQGLINVFYVVWQLVDSIMSFVQLASSDYLSYNFSCCCKLDLFHILHETALLKLIYITLV